jgi:hypothetical protein
MKTKISFIALGLGLLFTLACTKYPPATDRLLEDLAVLTQYDVTIDYSQYKTFQISDSVGVITNNDSSRVKNGNTMTVVNSIINNMKARGFTQVTKNADLAFNVIYFKNVHVNAYSPGWYWGYPGYYPPYWYGYNYNYSYPYYPVYYTSYTSGTLGWDMVDLKNANTDQKLYIRWTVIIRGLLTGTHSMSDITNSISKAFTQTPQISTSGK